MTRPRFIADDRIEVTSGDSKWRAAIQEDRDRWRVAVQGVAPEVRPRDVQDVELGPTDGGKVLVCPGIEDREVEPGDAPARCGGCGCQVAIPRRSVHLFGRDEPPGLRCRECRAKEDPTVWFPIADPPTFTYEFTAEIRDFTEKMKLLQAPFEQAAEYVRDAFPALSEASAQLSTRISSCQRCGQTIDDGSGRKTCKDCQRMSWRQRR